MPGNIIVGILGATKVWSGELVNGFATVTSAIFKVEQGGGFFSVWMQATSVISVPNLRLYYEMSYDNTPANFVTPNGFPDIVSILTAETVQIYAFSPPYLPYIRFKVRGNAGNEVDTLFTMYLCVQ